MGSQILSLSGQPITLAAGASLSVHIIGATTTNDLTSTDPALNVGGIDNYTVLYEGTGNNQLSINNDIVNGNIGVGGGQVQFNGPGTIGGRLDFAAANSGQYHNTNSSNVGPTSVNYSVSAVTTAINAVNSLSSALGGLAGTNISFNNANQTVNESSGKLETSGGVSYRVFNVTSYSENNAATVTIVGDGSGDPVVFNFAYNGNTNLGGQIALSGGLNADQVIWNFTSTNQNVQLNNNGEIYQGVILLPNDNFTSNSYNLTGRVYGGADGNMQIVSGANVYTPLMTATLSNTATTSATGDTGKSGETASASLTITSQVCATISGTKYLDLTGNGFSSDDTPLAGVDIYLYNSTETANLGSGTGYYELAVTAANGTYSFNNLPAGTYYVQEAVPSGYIQTYIQTGGGPNGSAGNTYYTVNVVVGQTYGGNNFDDYQIPTCTPKSYSFAVTNCNGATTTVSDLRGNTQQGDEVTVTVTTGSMADQLTLVSYIAPGPSFSSSTAYEQTIYDEETKLVPANTTTTLTVLIPNCDYQIDFICGPAINELGPTNVGPDGSDIFYSAQDRLLSADNEGTNAFASCSISTGDFASPSFWCNSNGQNLIKSFNGSSSSTQLGCWLATTYPNLCGVGGTCTTVQPNGTYSTSAQIATNFSTLSGADQQALATALSEYATSSLLAGYSATALATAKSDGLHVTADGSGGDSSSVGSNGASFGVANNTVLSIMRLLQLTNANTAVGAAVSNGASSVFNGITSAGKVNASVGLSATDNGFSPDQVRTAYGINDLSLDGTGQTIAIVDAYDDPGIFQSLDAFDTEFSTTTGGETLYDQYGPAAGFLTVVGEDGSANLPATDSAGPGVANWEMEEALDVEWTHAVAPGANIILVEANSPSLADLMTSVQTAANEPGVSVVSMSWGFEEGLSIDAAQEAYYDNYLTTPAGHQGVTFVASSGDFGAAVPQYPAMSPNVIAVGGTTLALNGDNSYNSETGWGYESSGLGAFIGSGGGISQYEAEPAYQDGVQSTGYRTAPDVAFDADPSTGVWIADTYNFSSAAEPFVQVGGTSLAAPAWAGLIALADQGRVDAGGSTLGTNGPTEAQTALYSISASDYNAVTSGTNGYTAGAGYNLVTGLGTPIANLLIPDLAAYNGTPSSTPAGSQAISAAELTLNSSLFNGDGSSDGADAQMNAFAVFNLATTSTAGDLHFGGDRTPLASEPQIDALDNLTSPAHPTAPVTVSETDTPVSLLISGSTLPSGSATPGDIPSSRHDESFSPTTLMSLTDSTSPNPVIPIVSIDSPGLVAAPIVDASQNDEDGVSVALNGIWL